MKNRINYFKSTKQGQQIIKPKCSIRYNYAEII